MMYFKNQQLFGIHHLCALLLFINKERKYDNKK